MCHYEILGNSKELTLHKKVFLPAQLKFGEAEVENLLCGNRLDLLRLQSRDGILQDRPPENAVLVNTVHHHVTVHCIPLVCSAQSHDIMAGITSHDIT